ncbi:hypothetical protein ACX0G9_04100 [Flavitalea flava]
MNTHTGKGRPFKIMAVVAVSLLFSILLDNFWVTSQFPWISGFVGINPIIVFLDIPVHLPFTIDLLPVSGLFFIFYPIFLLAYPSADKQSPRKNLRRRLWAVIAGLSSILVCLLAGGLTYYLIQDHLPRKVRNGIDSFGINADIYIPYPGHEVIHLRGSMILLLCFYMGMRIFLRKINKEPETKGNPISFADPANQGSRQEPPEVTNLQQPA